ncbi:MAG: hypothetical protein KDK70_22685 [Myxococcales bacterium]|nr:hypothetical protein [Myxococcales bacterium]
MLAAATCAEPSDGVDEAGETDEPSPESPWPLPRTCAAPSGLGQPTTIDEVVTLVNALPKPTSLTCLLESLDRPLSIYASTSTAGAQPATGPQNPRIFLFGGNLVMSVVPEGETSQTLELAQAIGERLSIKAELEFPVEQTLEPQAPYDQVNLGSGTSCGICHGSETRVTEIDFAEVWASDVLQDEPEQSLSLSFLRQSALTCDHAASPGRCEMLDAIFGHGEVDPGDLARDALICRPI